MLCLSLAVLGCGEEQTGESGNTGTSEPEQTTTPADVTTAKVMDSLTLEDITGETVFIAKDGSISVGYVDDFAESYYDLSELKEFMEEQLKAISDEIGSTVSLTSIDVKNKQVRAILSFADAKAFNAYEAEVGKIKVEVPGITEAAADYRATMFYNADNSLASMKTGGEVIDTKKQGAAVVSGPVTVITAGKIEFYSSGKLSGVRTLVLADDETAVILFTK